MKTSGLDHIVLTVSDMARSRQFYGELLGFDLKHIADDFPDPVYAGSSYFYVGAVEIFLVTHDRTTSGDRFSEFRVGLDHLAFKAPDEAALKALAEKLSAAGVATSGIELFAGRTPCLTFRDPDNIQLEYWLSRTQTDS